VVVGGSESLDVFGTSLPGINEVCRTPRKGRLSELSGVKIADDTRKAEPNRSCRNVM
jgi:hypothetical protein